MEKKMSYEEFTYRVGEPITDEFGKSPITPVFSLLQGKWRLHVIYALLCLGKARFLQIEKFCEPITPAALNTVLQDLIDLGIVTKSSPKNNVYSFYDLTEKGKDFMPCFYELMNWGFTYRVSKTKGKK
ncbi:MAG: helix-turn-helix domain-containing protein [Candidatus Enteromonas sp.]|nr:helix-turn-helix domain-containing protein [Candidatus Enteromonas sp.]